MQITTVGLCEVPQVRGPHLAAFAYQFNLQFNLRGLLNLAVFGFDCVAYPHEGRA